MTARYGKNATRPAAQRKDCKKRQLSLEAAALICTTNTTGNTELAGINTNTFTEKRKSSPGFEQSHPTHSCFWILGSIWLQTVSREVTCYSLLIGLVQRCHRIRQASQVQKAATQFPYAAMGSASPREEQNDTTCSTSLHQLSILKEGSLAAVWGHPKRQMPQKNGMHQKVCIDELYEKIHCILCIYVF